MNLKAILTGALLALFSTTMISSASAAQNCSTAAIKCNVPVTTAGINIGVGVNGGIVLPNQRYVPAFVDWVREPFVTYNVVRDPRTGRLVRVPVVVYNTRLVQVYYDRVTGIYFYISVYGQPLPY